MNIPEYKYPIDQCDVPAVRQPALSEYREFRRKCLSYIRGDANTSVTNQIHDLAWHTVVFRTLNEARRLEPHRAVNGAMWELITAGYSNLMTLGIRRLVDKHPETDSVWNVISQIEKRPELLTREKFICYDGLPYDCDIAYKKYVRSLDMTSGSHIGWIATEGPEAWGTSRMMHEAFDALSGYPAKRKRTDHIQLSILSNLKNLLSHPTIGKICTMVDKQVAHSERFVEGSDPIPIATYNDVDEALRIIVRVTNFLSSSFFYDAAFGSVVATPQFDVLAELDQPWVLPENIPALHQHWRTLSSTMDRWAYGTNDGFIEPRP